MLPLSSYETIIFDCDGVILNSNKSVSKCFFNSVVDYGEKYASELEEYNKLNGGVSRNKKLKHFFKNILKKENYMLDYEESLKKFSELSISSRLQCDINTSFLKYKPERTQRFLVISGANEEELRTIFHLREIKSFFNYGIFGSPESKDNIIVKKIQDNSIIFPALYIGDSKYDHVVSKDNNLDFVFISGWTEFDDWEQYCKINNLESFKSLSCVFK